MSEEEENARSHILTRLEAERQSREDRHCALLLGVIRAVLHADASSLPENVRQAREALIRMSFEPIGNGEAK